jgi:hypothetical protein
MNTVNAFKTWTHTSYPSKYALDKKAFEWKRISDLNLKYVLQKIKLLVFFGLK